MSRTAYKKIDRIRVLIIHGLLCRYMWEYCGGVKSTLLEQIHTFANTCCEGEIDKSDKDIFAYEPFRRFIENTVSPDSEKLDIFRKFLIQKEYLDNVFLEQSVTIFISCDAPKVFKADVSMYEGIYCCEAYADTQTFISSIMIFREARMYKLYAQLQENIYNQDENETGLQFHSRMDNGDYNCKRTSTGYIYRDGTAIKLKLCDIHQDNYSQKKRLIILNTASSELTYNSDSLDDSRMSATDARNLYQRIYINMSRQPDTLLGNITNLTNRQTNNMVNEGKRFARSGHVDAAYHYLYRPLKERDRTISQELNDVLLDAAEGGYPVDIVKALINGADINTQDEATGWTPLHYAARYSNPLIVAVMLNQQEQLLPILKEVAESENKSVEEIELRYSKAQAALDPTILSHEHRFASEMCVTAKTAYEYAQNKLFQIAEDVYDDISDAEESALNKKGLDSSLNVSPVHVRAEAMGLPPLQQQSIAPDLS